MKTDTALWKNILEWDPCSPQQPPPSQAVQPYKVPFSRGFTAGNVDCPLSVDAGDTVVTYFGEPVQKKEKIGQKQEGKRRQKSRTYSRMGPL